MNFKDKYTTDAKIKQEAENSEIKEKVEAKKIVLSNDAYAISEMVEKMNINLQNVIRSLAK